MDGMEDVCQYFIRSRQKNCKFSVIKGTSYCPTHTPSKARVPCPIDGRHSIYLKDIRSHLKKCSRTRDVCAEVCQPFYLEDCNVIDFSDPSKTPDFTKPTTVQCLSLSCGNLSSCYSIIHCRAHPSSRVVIYTPTLRCNTNEAGRTEGADRETDDQELDGDTMGRSTESDREGCR